MIYAHVEVPGYATQHIDLKAGDAATVEDVLEKVVETFAKSTYVRLGNVVFKADQVVFLSITEEADL